MRTGKQWWRATVVSGSAASLLSAFVAYRLSRRENRAPFAAINAHLREEVNYGGNLVAQAGWAWRRSPATGMYRIGVEYYNGKDDQFSFFNQSVEKIGLGMWYDY